MEAGQELRRTCNKCGTVWYVSSSELKRPGFLDMLGATGLHVGHHYRRQRDLRAFMVKWEDRVKALARCPQCRSTDHTEVAGG